MNACHVSGIYGLVGALFLLCIGSLEGAIVVGILGTAGWVIGELFRKAKEKGEEV